MGKLLFFDIDGTILPSLDGDIDDSTLAALKKAQANGHKLFINTGRTWCMLPNQVKTDIFSGYVCGLSTQIINNNQTLFYHTVGSEKTKWLIDIATRCKVELMLEGRDGMFFPKIASTITTDLRKNFENNGIKVGYISDEDATCDKFCVNYDENSNMEEFLLAIKDEFDYVKRFEGFGEAAPKGFDKSVGIKMLMKHYSVDIDDVYVFGDSTNDLGMLKFAKHAIGMGNGDPQIFEFCEFISLPLLEDGITHALKHYGLI